MCVVKIVDHEYVLRDQIGRGGMGVVFAAEDAHQVDVVVKMLRPGLAVDPRMVERLLEEASAGEQVSHDNVVRILDHGSTDDGAPLLVMEHVRGIPLGTLIRDRGPLPLSRIRSIASQILSGLAAIHRAGLVHGDVKSDNVLVDHAAGIDHIKIIDFGLARRSGTCLAAFGEEMMSGTPEYMAPEVIRGEPVTVAADLYAVAVILYEMVTGTTPFAGGTADEIFERHLVDAVVPPSLRCPDRAVPQRLEQVIMRDLDKEARHRHATAELFVSDVACALPPDCDDDPRAIESVAFSTSGPTRDGLAGRGASRR